MTDTEYESENGQDVPKVKWSECLCMPLPAICVKYDEIRYLKSSEGACKDCGASSAPLAQEDHASRSEENK